MKCKKCGNTIPEDCRFCTFCGAAVSEIDASGEKSDVSEPEKEAAVFSSDDMPADGTGSAAAETEETPETVRMADVHELDQKPETVSEAAETSKKLSAGRIFGASVISVFTVIFLIVFNLIFCAKIGLSGDIVRNAAKSMSSGAVLDSKYDGSETVLDYIYGCLDSSFIRESGAEAKDIRSILVRSDFSDFLADKLGEYADCIINGSHGEDPSLTADEIKIYLEEHDSVFSEELGYRMTVQDYQSISSSFEDDGLISDLSINEWSDDLGISLWNINFAFSFITIGIVFALVLVLYIWTAIVLDKRGRHVMGFFGSVTLIAGIVTFVPAVIFLIVSAQAALATGTLAAYAGSKILLPFAVIAACTGLFQIVVGVIFRKIRKHIKKRELKMNGGQ